MSRSRLNVTELSVSNKGDMPNGGLKNQVRKKTSQIAPNKRTVRLTLTIKSISMDGPGSACRASVGVSIITPCFLIGIGVVLTLNLRGETGSLEYGHILNFFGKSLEGVSSAVVASVNESNPSTVSLARLPASWRRGSGGGPSLPSPGLDVRAQPTSILDYSEDCRGKNLQA
jgi:hypothetical protein